MTITTTATCPCAGLTVCTQPLAHANCPCCMDFGPHDMAFGPADHNLGTPRQKSYHEDAAIKRKLAAERMQAQRGNGTCAGTPRSGSVSRMTTRTYNKLASDKQKNFIRSLLSDLNGDVAAEAVRSILNAKVEAHEPIDSATASSAIEALLAIKNNPNRDSAQPQRSNGVTRDMGKPNKRPQDCAGCGERVEALEGVLELEADGHWLVFHKEGECPVGGVEGIPAGYFAVEVEGTLKFYCLRPNGRLFVQASDELHPVKAAATRTLVLDLIKADVEGAARRYGQEIGKCCMCHRTLTDEASRAAGIGPICAGKQGW